MGEIRSLAKGHVIEPFFLSTRRPADAASNLGGLLRTVGTRVSGEFGQGWDYDVLLAAQGGEEAGVPRRAWAGVWEAGRTFESAPLAPRLAAEWAYASGDGDPDDGRVHTFDTLFPSPHGIFGEQDIVAFRNLKSFNVGVDLHPRKDLRVSVDLFDFRLAKRRDGLYRLNFRPGVSPPPSGADSGAIGSELDVVLAYQATRRVQIWGAVTRFFAGSFVTRHHPGGESQTFVVTALTVRL